MAEEGTTTAADEAPPDVSAGADWRANLSDAYEVKDEKTGAVTARYNFRTDGTLARYKTQDEAFRGLIEGQKALSAGAVKFPGADAKPEEWTAFRRDKLGAPKNLAGYAEVKRPEGVTEKGFNAFLQNVALPRGWQPKDVQDAANFLAENQAAEWRDLQQSWGERQEPIRKAWGLNYDRNMDISDRFVKSVMEQAGQGIEGGPEAVKEWFSMLDTMKHGYHPGFILVMQHMARHASEDVFVAGAPDGAANYSALDAKIGALSAELFNGTLAKSDPRYATLFAEYEAALKARHGTEEVGARPQER